MTLDDDAWALLKLRLPVGTDVAGTVTRHARFGFFLDLDGCPDVSSVVLAPDFERADGSSQGMSSFPDIGTHVRAEVVDHVDHGHQLRLRVASHVPVTVRSGRLVQPDEITVAQRLSALVATDLDDFATRVLARYPGLDVAATSGSAEPVAASISRVFRTAAGVRCLDVKVLVDRRGRRWVGRGLVVAPDGSAVMTTSDILISHDSTWESDLERLHQAVGELLAGALASADVQARLGACG